MKLLPSASPLVLVQSKDCGCLSLFTASSLMLPSPSEVCRRPKPSPSACLSSGAQREWSQSWWWCHLLGGLCKLPSTPCLTIITRHALCHTPLSQTCPFSSQLLVNPLATEKVGCCCDVGSAPSLLSSTFPHVDFSHLPEVWWHSPADRPNCSLRPSFRAKEPKESFESRVRRFRKWLLNRPEEKIVVVAHGCLLQELIKLGSLTPPHSKLKASASSAPPSLPTATTPTSISSPSCTEHGLPPLHWAGPEPFRFLKNCEALTLYLFE
eukprot:GILI01004734.1.p1 GENE.GILI01004734.1~~GILI01004734.1.p1  ORF type:complete len:267 (+),score=38.28 GILI01004734.1:493-1293(+)